MSKIVEMTSELQARIEAEVRKLNAEGKKISFMGVMSRDVNKTYFGPVEAQRSIDALRRAQSER